MPIDTNLNISPYFDDFDETKDFHQILFVPDQAVQARELTQLQTILRDQIEKFGDNVLQTGSIVKGCSFNYDSNYDYVKLRDLKVNLDQNIVSSLIGLTVKDNVSGLQATVVDSQDGYETQNPNTKTIYVKYSNTGSAGKKVFAADDVLDFYDSDGNIQSDLQVSVLPAVLNSQNTNPIGVGYAFSVSDGVVYQKGTFVRVSDGLKIIISKYDNSPNNVVVGFAATESLITPNIDTSLNDNASGFTNINAPGAHRLKISASLVTYAANSIPTSNFCVLAEWQNGQVVRENQYSQYNVIGQEFARRTSEESGDYTVTPFVLTTSDISGNTTYLNLNSTQGLAYVSGYRIEKLNALSIPLRKATNTNQLTNQQIVQNYGNYVFVNNLVGYFQNNQVPTISLRDTAGFSIANGVYSTTAPGNEIGQAKLLAVLQDDTTDVVGTANCQYRFYLTNITMNAGMNFSSVKAISGNNGLADVVLSNNTAILQETSFSSLIYPFVQGSVKTLRNGANNNNQYVFRTVNITPKILTTGTTGAITVSGTQQFPYGTGSLNNTQKNQIVVVPSTAANVTLTKSGTVTTNASVATVTGSSTAFVSEYQVGDFIYVGTQYRQILSIANNTSLTVGNVFTSTFTSNTHSKFYPANVPIPFANRNSSIVLSNNTSMALTLVASNGSTETLSGNLNLAIAYDVETVPATQINKNVLKNVYVKIDCSNNVGNTVGPWSLGLPDVYQIAGIYKSNTYTESSSTDVTAQFILDTGQQDALYGISSIKRIPGTTLSLSSSDKLLVKVNVFQANPGSGYGFFSVDSYPVDDANIANTTAIQTTDIPTYVSSRSGKQYNLRDSVDFRPVCVNNAIYATGANTASINPANTISITATENYVASPNQTFTAGLEYYLPRIDKLILDTYGNFKLVEGIPSSNPSVPSDVPATMSVAEIDVAPYPSLSMSNAAFLNRPLMQVNIIDMQTERFTMKDLSNLSKRISSLEYYASLNLLEQKTSSLTVTDVNGNDRFKNGIFVDTFDDLSGANINDFEFSAIVDTKNSIVRPASTQNVYELQLTAINDSAEQDEMLSISYNDTSLISQLLGSGSRNLGGSSWSYTAPVTQITPTYDPGFDSDTTPTTSAPTYFVTRNADGTFNYFSSPGVSVPDSVVQQQQADGIYPYFIIDDSVFENGGVNAIAGQTSGVQNAYNMTVAQLNKYLNGS